MYDRQLIVLFLAGGPSDRLIKDNAKAIHKKAQHNGLKSNICSFPCDPNRESSYKELKHELRKLTTASRLYIQGHGNWQSQKVANWGPEETANCLANCGMPPVEVISILACEAARDRNTADNARLAISCDSYASKFHECLMRAHGLKVIVFARVYSVSPIGPIWKNDFSKEDYKFWLGRKVTYDENDEATIDGYRQDNSKVRFEWKKGQQIRTVIDYGAQAMAAFDL